MQSTALIQIASNKNVHQITELGAAPCRRVSILSMLGITCTSILVVSVFGAVAADPHRKHLPVQVRHTAGLKSQSSILQEAGLQIEVHQKLKLTVLQLLKRAIVAYQLLSPC